MRCQKAEGLLRYSIQRQEELEGTQISGRASTCACDFTQKKNVGLSIVYCEIVPVTREFLSYYLWRKRKVSCVHCISEFSPCLKNWSLFGEAGYIYVPSLEFFSWRRKPCHRLIKVVVGWYELGFVPGTWLEEWVCHEVWFLLTFRAAVIRCSKKIIISDRICPLFFNNLGCIKDVCYK